MISDLPLDYRQQKQISMQFSFAIKMIIILLMIWLPQLEIQCLSLFVIAITERKFAVILDVIPTRKTSSRATIYNLFLRLPEHASNE
jgi:hypothetical protein